MFRVLLGGLICFNACIRLLDLEAHYGPDGISPIEFVINKRLYPGEWSLYLLHESIWLPAILLTITVIAGILLAIGYKAKYIKWLCLVLIISLNFRNYDYINSGDILLQLLLLWSLVLPVEDPSKKVNPIAGFGYTLQLACMYWFVVFSRKGNPVWHQENSAVRDALHIDQYSTPIGKALLQVPSEILLVLNDLVMLTETWAPIGLFIPYAPIQAIAAAALAMMHIGFTLTLALGIFGFVAITALVLFIPFKQKNSYKKQKNSKITSLATTGLIILLIGSNIANHTRLPVPSTIKTLSRSIGMNQKWNLFEEPLRNDGWFLVVGHTEQKKNTVLWPKYNQKYTEEKPANISGIYKNQRWRGFFTNLIGGSNGYNHVSLLQYMCKKHDYKFTSVELLYFLEETQPIPLPPKKAEKTSVLKLPCQNNPSIK